jgi:hypothetical protein
MKFLVFNLAVIGALAYLIVDNSRMNEAPVPKPVRNAEKTDPKISVVNEIKKVTNGLSQEFREVVASEFKKVKEPNPPLDITEIKAAPNSKIKNATLSSPREPKVMAPEFDKVKKLVPQLEVPENKAVPNSKVQNEPQSKTTEIAERTVHKVPQFDASKVSETNATHVSANSSETSQGEGGEKNRFMSTKERRRELNRLAREMELIFVDKLNM